MLLSHTFKCVFVHIPRTGGTWLTYKIRDADPESKGSGKEVALAHAHPRRYEYVRTGRHGTLQSIYELADVDLDDYFKFAISRHPYTRFQSCYRYYTNKTATSARAGFVNQHQMMDWLEQSGAQKNHVMPQSRWHDARLDHVFKFEEIENIDISKFIPNMPAYSKTSNRIIKTDNDHELDQSLKDRVYKFYKEDFKLFDYQP